QRRPNMEALVSELERVRTRRARLRGWLGGSAALSVVLAAAAVGGWRARERAARCAGGAQMLAGAWGPAQAQRIRSAFGPQRASRAQSVISALDAYGAQWLAARQSACEAGVRGEQPEEAFYQRMLCFSGQLTQLKATS